MRLHQVTSRLWTGPRQTPDQLLWCHEIGITHHLNVAKEHDLAPDLARPNHLALKIGIYDNEKHVTDEWIESIIHAGLQILSNPTNKLLITCLAGENRAPSAAYAILRAFGLPRGHAYYLSNHQTAPKYAHVVDRYLARTLNLP